MCGKVHTSAHLTLLNRRSDRYGRYTLLSATNWFLNSGVFLLLGSPSITLIPPFGFFYPSRLPFSPGEGQRSQIRVSAFSLCCMTSQTNYIEHCLCYFCVVCYENVMPSTTVIVSVSVVVSVVIFVVSWEQIEERRKMR